MSNKEFLKRLVTRVGLPVLVVCITTYLTNKYNINPFPEKKISLFAFFAIVVFIYVAIDLVKMIKAERNNDNK